MTRPITKPRMCGDLYAYKDQEKARRQAVAAQTRYRLRHPERCRDQARRWRAKSAGLIEGYRKKARELPEKRLMNLARCRIFAARKYGIPYDRVDLYALAAEAPQTCAICHNALNYLFGKGKQPDGPSIDKVLPEKGYVKNNIAVVCNGCNELKGRATADQHRAFAEFIEEFARKNAD